MNKSLKAALVVLFTLFATCAPAYCRIVTLIDGNFDFLRGEGNVNVEFVYDGMRVGKFDREQDYVTKKVNELNEKEPGKGDKWRDAWVDDRAGRYQPKFLELINRYTEKTGLHFGTFKDAKYTLILRTTFTEPGFEIFISRRPSLINANGTFVLTTKRDQTVAAVAIMKSPGNPAVSDFDTGERIQESYAKAGKELGILIRKKLK